MDRYQRVEKPRPESTINENEIRITAQGLIRNYISYATTLLQNNREKLATEIVLKAMGQAISKTVAIAEILKKRTPGLHQDTVISSVSITDIWEPIEEGLVPLEMTRHVSMISISLSTRMLSRNSPGYQPPLNIEQPKQQKYQQPKYYNQHQPPRKSTAQFSDDSFGQGHGRGRGKGRGRGSGRGWVQGGYGGYEGYGGYGGYPNNQGYSGKQGYTNNKGYPSNQGYANNQENGEWNNGWGRGGGRGGGRGPGGWGYHDDGYERGRGGGGGRGVRRRGRGRVGGRGRGNQLF